MLPPRFCRIEITFPVCVCVNTLLIPSHFLYSAPSDQQSYLPLLLELPSRAVSRADMAHTTCILLSPALRSLAPLAVLVLLVELVVNAPS